MGTKQIKKVSIIYFQVWHPANVLVPSLQAKCFFW